MWCTEIAAITLLLAVSTTGRVYYLQNVDKGPYADDAKYLSLAKESSRDLDLSFSAGDSEDVGNVRGPIKQIDNQLYARVTPEGSIANSDTSKPLAYYKLTGIPATPEDIIVLPEKHRKLVKIDDDKKGEIILELRVIANHDT